MHWNIIKLVICRFLNGEGLNNVTHDLKLDTCHIQYLYEVPGKEIERKLVDMKTLPVITEWNNKNSTYFYIPVFTTFVPRQIHLKISFFFFFKDRKETGNLALVLIQSLSGGHSEVIIKYLFFKRERLLKQVIKLQILWNKCSAKDPCILRSQKS